MLVMKITNINRPDELFDAFLDKVYSTDLVA